MRSAGVLEWNPVCSDMVLTRRKPLLLFSFDGVLLFRLDEVQLSALLFQVPPRFTRFDPEEEPSSGAKSLNMPLNPNQRDAPSLDAAHWAKRFSSSSPRPNWRTRWANVRRVRRNLARLSRQQSDQMRSPRNGTPSVTGATTVASSLTSSPRSPSSHSSQYRAVAIPPPCLW